MIETIAYTLFAIFAVFGIYSAVIEIMLFFSKRRGEIEDETPDLDDLFGNELYSDEDNADSDDDPETEEDDFFRT